jgi:hypothetical protein
MNRSSIPLGAHILVPALLLSTLASCADSGGRARTPGGIGPPGMTLNVDFGLRRDFLIGNGFVGDVKQFDFNGDGIQDLVETNFLGKQISIALGNPDGTFTTIVQRPTLGNAWRLALGDYDGDGLEDIAVASHVYQGTGASGIDVFLHGPTLGEFTAAPLSLAFPENPIDLESAPMSGMKGDSGPDELFLAVRKNGISRVIASGGALVESGMLDTSNFPSSGTPHSLTLVDLGANGLLDLVMGERNVPGGPDRVVQFPRLPGQASPNDFGSASLVMSPLSRPVVDNAGDADNNGFDDVAVAQNRDTVVYVLNGDAGGLSTSTAIDFGAPTTSLILPDLDGDGFAEAIATTTSNSVQVLPGTGPMAWGDPVHYNVGPVPRALDVINLPGDMIPDLLCSNAFDLTVMAGIGGGQFRGARGYESGVSGPATIELGDLDNDGDVDAVAVSRSQNAIAFLEGNGDGTFESMVVLPMMPTVNDRPVGLALADMDDDGDLDVLTAIIALDEIRLYRNNGSIDGFVDPLPGDITAVGTAPAGIAVGDMDGDTLPDVLVANTGDSTLQVLLNTGGGALNALAAMPVGFQPRGPLVTDLDLDGTMDAAVVGDDVGGDLVAVFAGDGMGGLALSSSFVLDGPSDSMATGDFDEDGRPDIVVGQTESKGDEAFLLMNQGGINYSAMRVAIDDGPANVMVFDIDNDQHHDIVTATTPGELRAWLGDGNGGLKSLVPADKGELPVPHQTLGARLGDLDGDTLLDLVLVSPSTPFIWVALNTSSPAAIP